MSIHLHWLVLLLAQQQQPAQPSSTTAGATRHYDFSLYDYVPLARPIDAAPPRQIAGVEANPSLSAPQITNEGHDFARLEWTPREGTVVGHRVYSSRWEPSFTARYAPDLSGVYTIDGETLEVCTQRDGILGEGRLAVYLHSRDGGFSALGMARWDTYQGGYAGVMLHSNDTTLSGPMLIYQHREGWLRLRSSWFLLDPNNYPQSPARHAEVVAGGIRPKVGCAMLPPAPRDHQPGARELSGRYFSNFNESLVLCTANGSLLVTFSGLGHVQGFASGKWVPERQRWEGTVAEIGAVRGFAWTVSEAGELSGVWDAYNRTYVAPETNDTSVVTWRAWPDRGEQEQLPTSLARPEAGGLALEPDHFCALLLAADSGGRPSDGDVADEEAQGELERAEAAEAAAGRTPAWHTTGRLGLARGYGGGVFETPQFDLICTNATLNLTLPDGRTVSNVTTTCVEEGGAYDVGGFYRRAPAEQRYAWARDVLAVEQVGRHTRAVAAPLAMGETYIFRVVALYHTAATTAGGGTPTQVWPWQVKELATGAPSAYSSKVAIRVSGPGAPLGLSCDDVRPNSLVLRWERPPFNQTSGEWHSDGGARLLGYRVYLRSADEAEWDEARHLVASTAQLGLRLDGLPPQTLWRIRVAAENVHRRGVYSEVLSVATAALRATLYSECGHASAVHQPLAYQGCFRDLDAPAGRAIMRPAPRLPGFSHTLSADLCAQACAPALFFGLRDGGRCLCGDAGGDAHTGTAANAAAANAAAANAAANAAATAATSTAADDEPPPPPPPPGFGRYGAVEDDECDRPCMGEARRPCGGLNRTSVYRRAGQHGVLLGVGAYHSFDLIRMRLGAGSLSSVALPPGLRLTLYTRDGLQGLSTNLTASVGCLREVACPRDPTAAATWAEPPPRCEGDVWDGQAVSLSLHYDTGGPLPAYTPRPSGESGARAFALGTAGRLARLFDLGGDIAAETVEDRPGVELTQYWLAPRTGDGDECAVRVGGYSSDRICLQSAGLVVPELQTRHVRRNPHSQQYEVLRRAQLEAEFTDEHARLMRVEWRKALRAYAKPFYYARIMEGQLDPSADFEPWFGGWFESIKPVAHLLSRQVVSTLDDDTTDAVATLADPVLGLSQTGELVPWARAAAPPLPEHPFPRAETRGDGLAAAPPAGGAEVEEAIRRLEAVGRPAPQGLTEAAAAKARYEAEAAAGQAALRYHSPEGLEPYADGERVAVDGPRHAKMQPYSLPKAVLREAEGRNPIYDQAYADAKAAAGERAAARAAGKTEDVERFFGMMR